MDIAITYIARGLDSDSLGNIRKFFTSYKKHRAGLAHKLIVVAKAWENLPEQYKILQEMANSHNAIIYDLPDDGFDFTAYYRVAEQIESNYIFCLGSFTEILYDNWLLLFKNAFDKNPKLEFAGVNGSWHICPSAEQALSSQNQNNIFKYQNLLLEVAKFPTSFPNYHVRTAAFMINRQLFIDYMAKLPPITHKAEAYQVEAGYNSLTKYILSLNHEIGVVGADDILYKKEDWNKSKTFWGSDYSNLLIKDKQVALFPSYSAELKFKLLLMTWGELPSFDQDEAIKIFAIYNKPSAYYFKNQIYSPIQTGASINQDDFGIWKDNSDDNISDKNRNFAELTAHYWVWKNYIKRHPEKKYIGFAHHRRLLVLKTAKIDKNPKIALSENKFIELFYQHSFNKTYFEEVEKYDLIITLPLILNNKTIREQYEECHIREDLNLLEKIVLKNYPEYQTSLEQVLNNNSIFFSTIFIMKTELFDEFCSWIFPLLFELEKSSDWTKYSGTYQERTPAYLHERLFNVWLHHKQQSVDLKIFHCAFAFCDNSLKEPTKKKSSFLKKVFSVKNIYEHNAKIKVLTILGVKVKIKRKKIY